MNASGQIIITIKETINGNIKQKDISVPVLAKLTEVFPEGVVKKENCSETIPLKSDTSFQSANILYGDILEVNYSKGD